ncbi:SCO family protein [Bacillus infantis]|jgi:protein SCO1|uniref:SCO family protein n=1 Tax=Bacillus infantis TaxID=324767 RepID=UPI003CF1737C
MKRLYWIGSILIIGGIAAGIAFFVIRDHSAEIPEDLSLINENGETFDFSERGQTLTLVEFIYTHCPDICPTTTQKMNMLRSDLEKDHVFGNKVKFMTVTIDPYRDTPEVLSKYMDTFDIKKDGNWVFLTGDKDSMKEDQKEIQKLANAFQFQYRDPGDGFYVHSTYVYLLDKDNKYIKKFPMGESFDRKEVYEKILKEL